MTLPVLEMRDVFKIFRTREVQTVALRGIHLEVFAGEFLSVVGRSGSGKSTLFSLLAGLSEPGAGEILLNGQNLGLLSENAQSQFRREHLAVTFQAGNLLSHLSALENVMLPMGFSGRKGAREAALDLLDQVGMKDRRNHRAGQLSGGEQARVGLAVALANRPRILLADEPTAELDSKTADGVMNLLQSLHQRGMTLLLVTHNPALAARASRTLHLQDGRFVPQGTA